MKALPQKLLDTKKCSPLVAFKNTNVLCHFLENPPACDSTVCTFLSNDNVNFINLILQK
jgi:hypothetical protein